MVTRESLVQSRIISVVSKPLTNAFDVNISGLKIMCAYQSYNKYKIILTSLRQAFQNFTFLENENSDMTSLKISFSNFLVQRLIL